MARLFIFPRWPAVYIALAVCFVGVCLFVWFFVLRVDMFVARYESLRLGMTKTEVFDILGPPDLSADDWLCGWSRSDVEIIVFFGQPTRNRRTEPVLKS
jgi:hypothetical protein